MGLIALLAIGFCGLCVLVSDCVLVVESVLDFGLDLLSLRFWSGSAGGESSGDRSKGRLSPVQGVCIVSLLSAPSGLWGVWAMLCSCSTAPQGVLALGSESHMRVSVDPFIAFNAEVISVPTPAIASAMDWVDSDLISAI